MADSKRKNRCLTLFLLFFAVCWSRAQDSSLVFLAYDRLPTYMALISAMQEQTATVHWLDSKKYKGHADYVSLVLEKGSTFAAFKAAVRDPATRKYLPVFVHDLQKMPVTIAKKKYNWVLSVVGYHYIDGETDLSNSILKAANAVQKALEKRSPTIGKGLILLATNPAVKPNTSLAPRLNKAGFGNCTIEELLKNTNAATQKVLNAGKAVGVLKFIAAGSEAKTPVSINDIAIYETLPDRVPIAAGFISLQAQTPLSHVNLLAKNRGTVNIYTKNSGFLADFGVKNGDLVALTAYSRGFKSGFSIKKATLAEQAAWQEAHRQIAVDIPTANYDLQAICYFGRDAKKTEKISCIGAKAANYAYLQAALKDTKYSTAIRKGFAIPFCFYKETIELSRATGLIDSFLAQKNTLSEEEKMAFLARIRKKIKHGLVSKNLLSQIHALCAVHFVNTKIRLRSSTNCEDLPNFNGAGLYDSKGFRTTETATDSLQKRLLAVYASLWNDAAFAEREFYGINHRAVAMAILINEAFEDEWANGVVISQPAPVEKSTKKEQGEQGISIYINSQLGAHLVTNPKPSETPEAISFKRSDSEWFATEQKSNLGAIFNQNSATRALAFELRDLTAKIHRLLVTEKKGYGVDIEFKIMKQKDGNQATVYRLYIKQARLLRAVLPE